MLRCKFRVKIRFLYFDTSKSLPLNLHVLLNFSGRFQPPNVRYNTVGNFGGLSYLFDGEDTYDTCEGSSYDATAEEHAGAGSDIVPLDKFMTGYKHLEEISFMKVTPLRFGSIFFLICFSLSLSTRLM